MTFNYRLPLPNTRSLPLATGCSTCHTFQTSPLRRLVHSLVFPGRGATRWNIALHLLIRKRYVLLPELPVQYHLLLCCKAHHYHSRRMLCATFNPRQTRLTTNILPLTAQHFSRSLEEEQCSGGKTDGAAH
jgi:hypothetical protein